MNTQDLINDVKRMYPDLDDYEYLSELNKAQIEVWEKLIQADSSYFEDIKTVTVAADSAYFDMLLNTDFNLSSAIHSRLYQINRIRCLPSGSDAWQLAIPGSDKDSAWLNRQQLNSPPVQTSGAYRYRITGKGTLEFSRPIATGTSIEATYIFAPLPLAKTIVGSISSSGTSVTGNGTAFLSLLPPDDQPLYATGDDVETQIEAELIVGGLPYRIDSISSDSFLSTFVAVSPVASTSEYNLVTLPDIPFPHQRILSLIAARNLAFNGKTDDEQLLYNKYIFAVEQAMNAMYATVALRQNQRYPHRKRFPRSPTAGGRSSIVVV